MYFGVWTQAVLHAIRGPDLAKAGLRRLGAFRFCLSFQTGGSRCLKVDYMFLRGVVALEVRVSVLFVDFGTLFSFEFSKKMRFPM